jgi:hypothetical protein
MRQNALPPEGPQRFVRNWLAFNESRLTQAHLLRNFTALVAALLAASAVLMIVSH